MRRVMIPALVTALLAVLLLAVPASGAHGGDVVVANRASGSISVLDATSGDLLGTYALPDGGEPMYVTASADGFRVFVGDRANDRVVVFDGDDYSVLATVPAGAGVFHQWQNEGQLWVNNDVDNTTTVIDPRSLPDAVRDALGRHE